MTERFLFADEAGCFTFKREQNVSRYFMLCTVTTSDLQAATSLHELRRKLIWDGVELGDFFHATVEKQAVRDRVFETMLQHDFEVQVTICEKSKAQPQVRRDKARFYQYAWFYHFRYGIAPYIPEDTDLLVTAASLGTKKEKLSFTNCLSDVMGQTVRKARWAVDFRPSATDCCLQIADYCAWAIQRKWERGDTRSYDMIKAKITYEYDLWKHGAKHHY
ncbi:DUF3800 domain-containing protein [Rhizobium leguminosarum]|uniref:DUF3800 domain-containing protein n=1 Tax=Rhizobium leguminosarum TaxID=384 RepID=UPI00035FB222|nr:DUF3800 domain-containing protein [Rhizobium leguminosarum]